MRLEFRLLQVLIVPLGIAAVAIGVMIIFSGVLATLHLFESSYAFILGVAPSLEPKTVAPTIDNEFRFYAVLWLSYGLLSLWVAMKIETRFQLVPFLLGVFFAGGVARALSLYAVGEPHPLFILLMYIELLAPVIGGIVYLKAVNSNGGEGAQ